MTDQHPIMLFDGECAMCNGAVQFVLTHDRNNVLRFASLQSELGQQYLKQLDLPQHDFNSYLVIDEQKAFDKSRAVYKMFFYMGGGWRYLAYLTLLVPRVISDAIYSYGFKNRYKWFGKSTQCRLVSADQQHRFLDINVSSFALKPK